MSHKRKSKSNQRKSIKPKTKTTIHEYQPINHKTLQQLNNNSYDNLKNKLNKILYIILASYSVYSFFALCIFLLDISKNYDTFPVIFKSSYLFLIASIVAFIIYKYFCFSNYLLKKPILRCFLSYGYWVVVLSTILGHFSICLNNCDKLIQPSNLHNKVFYTVSITFCICSCIWIFPYHSDSNTIIAIKQVIFQIVCSILTVFGMFLNDFIKLFSELNGILIIYSIILLIYLLCPQFLQIKIIIESTL